MAILVLGYEAESTVNHTVNALKERDADVRVLDLGRLRECKKLELFGNVTDLVIRMDEEEWDLSTFSAFYCRHYQTSLGHPLRDEALGRIVAWLNAYAESTESCVVNRPSAGSRNSRKFDQTLHLAQHGFDVPETYLLGSAERASAIVTAERDWASKSCSSIKTKAVRVTPEMTTLFRRLETCPSQFQRVVTGYDVRAHVVGDVVIGLRIDAPPSRFDYRFKSGEDEAVKFSEVELPPELSRLCTTYCGAEELEFAGFDFKVDEDGRWQVLECNPMPGYDFFDRPLEGRIAAALVDHLQQAPKRASKDHSKPVPFVDASRRPKLSPF